MFGLSFGVEESWAAEVADRLDKLSDDDGAFALFVGYHNYTVSGEEHHFQTSVAIPASKDSSASFHLQVSQQPKSEPRAGRRLTGKDLDEFVEEGLAASSAPGLLRAEFKFPQDEYESPLVVRSGGGQELSLDSDVDVGPLIRTGVRYSSEDGLNDILIDGSPGPLLLRVKLVWREVGSLSELRKEVRSVSEFADLLVRRKEGGDPKE